MKPLYFTSEQYLHKAERISPSSVSFLKVICEWPFFKSGDRYSEFLTIGHISFEVSEEGKELSPSQVQYNKHGKYMSLSIKTFYAHRVSFFQRKMTAILSTKRATINTFSETGN